MNQRCWEKNGCQWNCDALFSLSTCVSAMPICPCDIMWRGDTLCAHFFHCAFFFSLGRTACRIARLCMKSEWLSLQAEIPCNVVFLAESKWIEIWISPGPEILFFDVFLFLVDVVARIARVSCRCQSVISGHGTGFRVLMMGGIEQVPGFDETQDSGRKLQILWRNMKEKKNTWKHDKILMSRDVYSRDMSQRLNSPYALLIFGFQDGSAKVSSCTNWRSRAAFVSSLSESIAMAIEARLESFCAIMCVVMCWTCIDDFVWQSVFGLINLHINLSIYHLHPFASLLLRPFMSLWEHTDLWN